MQQENKSIISPDIALAARWLKQNDVIAIPTETVYGLAGNIFSDEAIRKIFEVKQRPLFNPLIVHIGIREQWHEVVSNIPPIAEKLADAFWPGPLTMVLPKKATISDLVTAGKDTVAVRMPDHPVTLELLKSLPFPLAAPSANPFGSISPTSAQHVERYFGKTLPIILDGGPCTAGIESTIIGFNDGRPMVYRLGSISLEDIERIAGPVEVRNKKEIAPDAPGMLERHYAPNTPTYLTSDVAAFAAGRPDKAIGVLTFSVAISATNIKHLEVLSATSDLKEAMANVYAALHKLDAAGVDMIVIERLPDFGLGKSINDRLERATK